MLFTCLPPEGRQPTDLIRGARIPGRFPGPAHTRGKWFAIDIHCHTRTAKATEMVEGNEAVSRWYLETAAASKSQAINRDNAMRTSL